MTREEAIKELQEEWNIFLEGTGLKYKTEEGFQKELEDNPDLKKVVEAHYIAIKVLEQEPVLDKIRAEIEEEYGDYDICEWFEDYDYEENNISEYQQVGEVSDILEIIDKYKAGMRGSEDDSN